MLILGLIYRNNCDYDQQKLLISQYFFDTVILSLFSQMVLFFTDKY